MNKRRITIFLMGAGLTLVLIGLSSLRTDRPQVAQAQDGGDEMPEITGENSYCALCHSQEDNTITLANGTSLDLHVTPEMIQNSVHGESNQLGAFGCVDCHGENVFPHLGNPPEDARAFAIESTQICTQCHTEQASGQADSVHAQGLARGNLRAATCVDCHGSHTITPIKDQPEIAANVCGACHTSIFDEYKESIHGKALLERNDTNAPTCIDCHGVHGINNPTTAQARNRSPELCATCHADEALMNEYNISTNVFNSYINEFHGTTVALFDQQDPDVASNKAVCYDCHGVHNITPADDSKSQVAKENLLATCQQCHPNATSDFPDSWVGHFEPSAEENPLVFTVDLFYKILIPTVLGGFGFLVVTDIFGRVRTRFGKGGQPHGN